MREVTAYFVVEQIQDALPGVGKEAANQLDRISRSLSDFVNILQEFKEHKVEFVSSQESFDTSSPYGEMIVKLLMVFGS